MLEVLVEVIVVCLIVAICNCEEGDVEQPAYYTVQEHLSRKDGLSAAQRELRVEDFFWSGSGDGPPEFLKKVHSSGKDGKEVIIKTETLIATVYVEGQNEEDMLCLDCTGNANGLPLNFTSDRRYWLLTVVAGFLRPPDFPLLEGNLAKLYRIAFTRQQSFHLGITNNLAERHNNTDRSKRHTLMYQLRYKRKIKRAVVPPDIEDDDLQQVAAPETKTDTGVKDNKAKLFDPRTPDPNIRILIHNVTLITEDDIQNWDNNYDDLSDQRNSRPMANQTEIIYSVFVNGKPVLATTAAEDMKLVSESEVISVMKKDIYMKAEPYLKEPQATPLVPAGKGGNVYNVFNSHPVMIAIVSVIVLLLIILLIALLLMTRAKRQRSAEVKRLSSRQGLLSNRSEGDGPGSRGRATDMATSGLEFNEGIDNGAFVYDHPKKSKMDSGKRDYPTIDFPLPPTSRPDSSSTTSTSDSSVYCPVNKPDIDLQTMLDEKANKLFDKKKRTTTTEINEKSEHTYSSAVKKRDKRTKTKAKTKRKYLAENRVGSIEETAQVHSAQGSFSTDSASDSLKPDFEYFEHNEAFNPNTHYHRNKVLGDRMFSDKIYDTVDNNCVSPTQAINREIIKALEPGEKTSESGSIGSFLSMASVKSFPRQQMPEPLHRVLEPVSVTHYDYFDNTVSSGTIKKPKGTKTVTLVDYSRHTQSDTPDPGVIGPIVWEIHKKRLGNQNGSVDSPVRDPASTRNRFEGLLEGAIQMYEAESSPKKSPEKGMSGSYTRRKDVRGKSAIIPNFPRLPRSNSDNRPVTAGPTQSHSNNSTQPPTPNSRAWGSGAPSPLVRPLSAGPFHCPDPPTVDVTRVLAHQSTDKTQLSAAPLIEAIQNELKKFKRENSK